MTDTKCVTKYLNALQSQNKDKLMLKPALIDKKK